MEVSSTEKLGHVISFINEWKSHGDVKEACDKFKVDRSQASKILKGKMRPTNFDWLKYLKDKAMKNYNKSRI